MRPKAIRRPSRWQQAPQQTVKDSHKCLQAGLGDHSSGTMFRNLVQSLEYLGDADQRQVLKAFERIPLGPWSGEPELRLFIQNEASSRWGLKGR